MKAGRPKCLRCGEDLLPAENPAEAAASSPSPAPWLSNGRSRLVLAAAGISLLIFVVILRNQLSEAIPVSPTLQAAADSPSVAATREPVRERLAERTTLELTPGQSGQAAYARGDFQAALAEFQ